MKLPRLRNVVKRNNMRGKCRGILKGPIDETMKKYEYVPRWRQ